MTAYNPQWLDALRIREMVAAWRRNEWLGEDKWKHIQAHYPESFYSPNLFVRIGLAFFSLILLSAAMGLLGLFFDPDSEIAFAGFCLFVGVLALLFLEFWAIRSARHYGSGVDDMLLYFAVGSIIAGLCMPMPYQTDEVVYYSVALPFLVLASVRYLDRVLSAAAFLCGLLICLKIAMQVPKLAIYLLPLTGMLFSVAIYLFAREGQRRYNWRFWHRQLALLEWMSIVTLYLSINYWVVQLFAFEALQIENIPLPWFFWVLTFVLPVAYIWAGVQQKDRLMLDTGLGAAAGAVFTFRYFFHVLPWAWAAVIAGAVLFLGAYFSIRYLRNQKCPYTYASEGDKIWLQELEEQLIEQTIASQNPPVPVKKDGFGGGQFGGGGAEGNF